MPRAPPPPPPAPPPPPPSCPRSVCKRAAPPGAAPAACTSAAMSSWPSGVPACCSRPMSCADNAAVVGGAPAGRGGDMSPPSSPPAPPASSAPASTSASSSSPASSPPSPPAPPESSSLPSASAPPTSSAASSGIGAVRPFATRRAMPSDMPACFRSQATTAMLRLVRAIRSAERTLHSNPRAAILRATGSTVLAMAPRATIEKLSWSTAAVRRAASAAESRASARSASVTSSYVCTSSL
mmetsp:Transcript_3938/g.14638  ORF Transcript_3938/g.14638 Transcript_3938/m.14638 type:complete len:240 (-) Transcript_3938:587-1306(-)